MRIAIIGAGNAGKALGTSGETRGHAVTHGVRHPHDAKYDGLTTASVAAAALTDAGDRALKRGQARDIAFALMRRGH